MHRLRFLALLLVLPLLTPTASAQNEQLLDTIVAVVDGEVVLHSEVVFVAQQIAQGQIATDAVYSQALDELVGQKVLLAEAQRDTTIIVEPDQVDQVLDQRLGQLTQQLGSEEALEEAYSRPIAQIRQDFRDEIEKQLLTQQIRDRKMRTVRVTPSEVQEFFDEIPAAELPEVPEIVRVAHIVRLPTPDEEAREAAVAEITAIRDTILTEAATFEDMAQRYSDDPGSRTRGGRIANVSVRDLVPEFGAVASTLEPGAVSQVFETSFGYHVMRLNERRGDMIDVNHVLIQVDDSAVDPAEAIGLLETLRDSLVTQEVPFEALAKRHSEDPFSATQGGYVTDPRTGDRNLQLALLGPQWQATVDTMSVDEVSAPAEVQLLDGTRAWHIVLLQRRTPPHTLDPITDYALLSEYALQEKRQSELVAYIGRLRERVQVMIKSDRYVAPEQRAGTLGGT
ncbi:MAG: peptidylprolyl isomerase [Bacteroidota bacterium]